MKTLWLWLTVGLIFLAGCAQTTPAQPAQPANPASTVGGSATSASTVAQTQTPLPGPVIPTATPVITQSKGKFTVQLFSNADVEVNAATYTITGRAPVETVISCNKQISVVGKNQTFNFSVPLSQGPNLIEVVASDPSGDEVSFEITVTNTAQ